MTNGETAIYLKWRGTTQNPEEIPVFHGGFVSGSWYMREAILALPQVQGNAVLIAAIGAVLDVPQ